MSLTFSLSVLLIIIVSITISLVYVHAHFYKSNGNKGAGRSFLDDFSSDMGKLFGGEEQQSAKEAALRNTPYSETKNTEALFHGEVPWRDQPPTLDEFDLPDDYLDIISV